MLSSKGSSGVNSSTNLLGQTYPPQQTLIPQEDLEMTHQVSFFVQADIKYLKRLQKPWNLVAGAFLKGLWSHGVNHQPFLHNTLNHRTEIQEEYRSVRAFDLNHLGSGLKLAGYLAAAGLNLLTQLSGRIHCFTDMIKSHWISLSNQEFCNALSKKVHRFLQNTEHPFQPDNWASRLRHATTRYPGHFSPMLVQVQGLYTSKLILHVSLWSPKYLVISWL